MFRTCDKHDDCIVVHDQILKCPVCNAMEKLQDEVLRVEAEYAKLEEELTENEGEERDGIT